jgi:hypothetical protein
MILAVESLAKTRPRRDALDGTAGGGGGIPWGIGQRRAFRSASDGYGHPNQWRTIQMNRRGSSVWSAFLVAALMVAIPTVYAQAPSDFATEPDKSMAMPTSRSSRAT